MSRLSIACRLIPAAAGAVALVTQSPASAQTVAETKARIALLEERRAALRGFTADTVRYDTVRVAPFVALTVPRWRSHVENVLSATARWLTDSIGSDAEIFGQAMLSVHVYDGVPMPRAADSLHRVGIYDDETPLEGNVRRLLDAFVDGGKWRDIEPGEDWFGGTLPLLDSADHVYSRTLMDMVTSDSPAVRACFAGDVEMCRVVFFPRQDDDIIGSWFGDVAQWWVMRSIPLVARRDREESPNVEDCEDGVEAACLRLFREIPVDSLTPPMRSYAHRGVLLAAVELGGDGTYTRFLETGGLPMEQRFRRASGVPTDSLFAFWLSKVEAARPNQTVSSPRTNWAVLASCVFLVFLALRSSRWR